jgi:hypothetical protein
VGTREEGTQGVTIRGYSSRMRPNQHPAWNCIECGEPVFVDVDAALGAGSTITDRVAYVHHGCIRISASDRPVSNVIPVGGKAKP